MAYTSLRIPIVEDKAYISVEQQAREKAHLKGKVIFVLEYGCG